MRKHKAAPHLQNGHFFGFREDATLEDVLALHGVYGCKVRSLSSTVTTTGRGTDKGFNRLRVVLDLAVGSGDARRRKRTIVVLGREWTLTTQLDPGGGVHWTVECRLGVLLGGIAKDRREAAREVKRSAEFAEPHFPGSRYEMVGLDVVLKASP